ncbi:hypothetical protein P7K49_037768 [Saguinus oedipus]|uniref:CREG-like beta-barrel domain-containing protein n=1 Tax=Saguinus oedipus TaxID=9490 RepID=A0ABQ9TJG7_SAGOE|nr:hypothetical protein P7K49_037768 [Saguinus oedipus]
MPENPYATLTMTLAQTNFCKKHGFDPQSPLCAHIMLSGTVTKVNETEVDIAKHSLFIRHPEMKTWPSSHNWFFAKLNITNIWVLDYFGGPKIVTPEEYYNVTVQNYDQDSNSPGACFAAVHAGKTRATDRLLGWQGHLTFICGHPGISSSYKRCSRPLLSRGSSMFVLSLILCPLVHIQIFPSEDTECVTHHSCLLSCLSLVQKDWPHYGAPE